MSHNRNVLFLATCRALGLDIEHFDCAPAAFDILGESKCNGAPTQLPQSLS